MTQCLYTTPSLGCKAHAVNASACDNLVDKVPWKHQCTARQQLGRQAAAACDCSNTGQMVLTCPVYSSHMVTPNAYISAGVPMRPYRSSSALARCGERSEHAQQCCSRTLEDMMKQHQQGCTPLHATKTRSFSAQVVFTPCSALQHQHRTFVLQCCI